MPGGDWPWMTLWQSWKISTQSVIKNRWQKYGKDLKDGNISFWKHMLSLYAISHQNICKLVEIIFSIADNTGPLERSYSRLAKLWPKDRNKLSTPHMETQYIIGILKDWDFDYETPRKIMESSVWYGLSKLYQHLPLNWLLCDIFLFF